MNVTKVLQIERADAVEFLEGMVVDMVEEVGRAQVLLGLPLGYLKPRYRKYFLGQAEAVLAFVTAMDIYINRHKFDFLNKVIRDCRG